VDKRKLIMILDLRGQSDSELLALTDMLVNEEINWIFLDAVTKDYECDHNNVCNCCDGVNGVIRKIKKLLVGGNQNGIIKK